MKQKDDHSTLLIEIFFLSSMRWGKSKTNNTKKKIAQKNFCKTIQKQTPKLLFVFSLLKYKNKKKKLLIFCFLLHFLFFVGRISRGMLGVLNSFVCFFFERLLFLVLSHSFV